MRGIFEKSCTFHISFFLLQIFLGSYFQLLEYLDFFFFKRCRNVSENLGKLIYCTNLYKFAFLFSEFLDIKIFLHLDRYVNKFKHDSAKYTQLNIFMHTISLGIISLD